MVLQDEGKVRKIGVSNAYDISILEVLATERMVEVVQNRWYEGNQWDAAVCRYCKENGIQYQCAYSSNLKILDGSLNAFDQGILDTVRFSTSPEKF